MQIFLVYRNSDMTEGRGPMVVDCAFKHKEDAEAYIDMRPGVMGRRDNWRLRKSGDWEVRPIEVHNSVHEAERIQNERIRAQALTKLTHEERRILGLE